MILLLVLIVSNLSASKLDKAYKALRIYDYFKAKENFEKSIKKDSLGACFGLSIIYYRKDNPFHNIDSAYKFISIVENKFNTLEEKKDTLFYENINGFFQKPLHKTKIYKDTIYNLKNKVVDYIYKKTSPKAYDYFINKYKDYNKIDEVILLRDSLEFDNAKKIDTYEGYTYYYETYPKSRFIDKAKKLSRDRTFIENIGKGTLDDYEKFVKEYPDNPHIKKAIDKIYELSIKEKTIEEYETFIKRFSYHPEIKEVWEKLYLLSFTNFTTKELKKFYKNKNIPNKLKQKAVFNIKNRDKEYLIFSKNDKYGLIDLEGKIIIKPKYEFINKFSQGLALVGSEEKIAFIDKYGKIVIDYKYYGGEDFKNGVSIVDNGIFFGMINKAGEEIIPFEYDYLSWAKDDILLAMKDDKYFYIDKWGNFVFDEIYDYAEKFKKNRALVKINDKYGIINNKGKYLLPLKYDKIEDKETYFKVFLKEKQGILDSNFNIILNPKYEVLSDISENFITFTNNEKYGYIDCEKKKISIKAKYSKYKGFLENSRFKNGYAIVCYKEKYGLINKKGKTIIGRNYEDIKEFSEGLIPFKKKGKWGFLNIKERVKIKRKYQEANSFKNGISFVKYKNKWGAINKSNKPVIGFKYDFLNYFDEEWIIFSLNNLYGIMNKKYKKILNCNNKEITHYSKNILKLTDEKGDIFYFKIKEEKIIP